MQELTKTRVSPPTQLDGSDDNIVGHTKFCKKIASYWIDHEWHETLAYAILLVVYLTQCSNLSPDELFLILLKVFFRPLNLHRDAHFKANSLKITSNILSVPSNFMVQMNRQFQFFLILYHSFYFSQGNIQKYSTCCHEYYLNTMLFIFTMSVV